LLFVPSTGVEVQLMYMRIGTVSTRLSGHHAALVLGSLAIMRDALALASGHESDRVLSRLEAIDRFGRVELAEGERARLARPSLSRSRRTLVDHLALAGQRALLGGAAGRKTSGDQKGDAEAQLEGDAALQARIMHGLLHGVSSDDGFSVEQLEGGSLAAVFKDGVEAIRAQFAEVLKNARHLLPGEDASVAKSAAMTSITQLTGEVQKPKGGREEPVAAVHDSVRVSPNPRLVAAGLMAMSLGELQRVLASMKATEFVMLENGGEGFDA
jgi:hypothetical protein